MSLFVMTRARYQLLCALVGGSRTISELQDVLDTEHQSNLSQQSIALRNAGLIRPIGSRSATGLRGPKPILYHLTPPGAAAIQAARVALACKTSVILDLSALEVAA